MRAVIRLRLLVPLALTTFLVSPPASAQPCGQTSPGSVPGVTCAAPSGASPGTRPSYPWQDHFTALTRLGMHWMPSFGDGDSMSRPLWHDQGTATPPFGSQGLQETWYIARDSTQPGTAPFYALFGGSDHMDSANSSEAWYTLDLGIPHGYAWTSNQGGMRPITRYLKSSIFDHRTWLNSCAPTGYSSDTVYSTATSAPRYGYERYGNFPDQCSVISHAGAIGTRVANSKVRVGFNPIWGNAIGEITHLGTGKQIVSHSIGDMVQSVLWYGGTGGVLLNPTQSGGADCWDYGNTRRWAGSPVLVPASVSSTTPRTVTTTVRPLNFCHNDFQGNDPWSPLSWRGQFRLTTTVGCKLNGVLRDEVIQIRHEAKKDSDTTFTDNPINMNNVGWLRAEPFGDCRNGDVAAELINLSTGQIEVSDLLGCGSQLAYKPQADRGVRVISADGTFAVGFVHLGTVWQYSVWFRCGFSCSQPNQNLVVGVDNFRNLSKTAWSSEEVFWVVGTPAEVLDRMKAIKSDGGVCSI